MTFGRLILLSLFKTVAEEIVFVLGKLFLSIITLFLCPALLCRYVMVSLCVSLSHCVAVSLCLCLPASLLQVRRDQRKSAGAAGSECRGECERSLTALNQLQTSVIFI